MCHIKSAVVIVEILSELCILGFNYEILHNVGLHVSRPLIVSALDGIFGYQFMQGWPAYPQFVSGACHIALVAA